MLPTSTSKALVSGCALCLQPFLRWIYATSLWTDVLRACPSNWIGLCREVCTWSLWLCILQSIYRSKLKELGRKVERPWYRFHNLPNKSCTYVCTYICVSMVGLDLIISNVCIVLYDTYRKLHRSLSPPRCAVRAHLS